MARLQVGQSDRVTGPYPAPDSADEVKHKGGAGALEPVSAFPKGRNPCGI